ncbi:hypothetical protein CMUS01_11445 [Colletotrichum musicola]|uniref:Uncharacterized protein n=1 Tax=Colletotrichum musicola TaxID=2175873 RepID=A0A8H6N6D4_9PEZI|nr:hypothetical protein CMUS01_11445 [Colletotrichum musicola]
MADESPKINWPRSRHCCLSELYADRNGKHLTTPQSKHSIYQHLLLQLDTIRCISHSPLSHAVVDYERPASFPAVNKLGQQEDGIRQSGPHLQRLAGTCRPMQRHLRPKEGITGSQQSPEWSSPAAVGGDSGHLHRRTLQLPGTHEIFKRRPTAVFHGV